MEVINRGENIPRKLFSCFIFSPGSADLEDMIKTPYQSSISPFVGDASTTPMFSSGPMFTPAAFTPYGAGDASPGYAMSPGYTSPFYG